MNARITAKTRIAGVVGSPVRHSLSPLLHNAWLQSAGIDGAYLAFGPRPDDFESFIRGLRGGVAAGLNITIPFKERALALADRADPLAQACGAANLLLFHEDGTIEARNTDGQGLIEAFHAQAPNVDLRSGPVVIFGAGGAARAAAAALLAAGAPETRIVNRTVSRAVELTRQLGEGAVAFGEDQMDAAVDGAVALINATSLGLGGGSGPAAPWNRVSPTAAAMDMVYRPLVTDFLSCASAHGLRTVDGLEMLIRQAIPSFEAIFRAPTPAKIDARRLLLAELEPALTESAR
jgi:shikimate dehydrogenase